MSAPFAGHLAAALEHELGEQKFTVAREVRRLQALEDLCAYILRVEADHGADFVVEDLTHLESLVGGDPVLEARLDDLVERSRPTRRPA